MKTKEELNAIKAEVETLSKKLLELTEEELIQVTAGAAEEGLNGHIFAVPTTEAASGYEDVFKVPDSPDSAKQYEFHFYSTKKPTDKDF